MSCAIPNFIAKAGLTGVLWEDQGGFFLRMDEMLDGVTEEWDNGIQWFPAEATSPAADLALIPANQLVRRSVAETPGIPRVLDDGVNRYTTVSTARSEYHFAGGGRATGAALPVGELSP